MDRINLAHDFSHMGSVTRHNKHWSVIVRKEKETK